MKLDDALKHLARPGIHDLALQTGKLPCVGVNGKFQPIAQTPLENEAILELLVGLGGARYVDNIGTAPIRWATKREPLGVLTVVAVNRNGAIQARVSRSQEAPQAAPPQAAAPQAAAPHAAPAQAAAVARAPAVAPPAEPEPVRRAPAAPAHLGGAREIDLGAPAAPGGEVDALLSRSLEMDDAAPASSRRDVPDPRGAIDVGFGGAKQAEVIRGDNADVFATLQDRRGAVSGGTSIDTFDGLLARARESRASDLHFVAERPALLRIAGELRTVGDAFAADKVAAMVMPCVPERLLSTLEREGSCDFALLHPKFGRFRANVSKQRTGLKATLRLIPAQIPTLATLGLPDAIGAATKHHQGLIVLTGPTGHGKTSTLAALVDLINANTSHHVITVEDPIEYLHPRKKAMLSQREVGAHTKTFAAALKGSLREDPDVIVVGELRDTETVRMALSASETGHLVISTMNTPSAAKTIDRLIDLFPPGDQAQVRMTLAGGLRLIVSQRLLANVAKDGVVAAAEILPGNVALWNLIRDNKTFQIPSLQQRGKAMGIVRLDDSLAELVRSGKTSLESAVAYAEAPDDFIALLSGGGKPAVVGTVDRNKPQPQAQPAQAQPEKGGMLGRAGALFGGKKG